MNDELAKASVYTAPERSLVQGFSQIRNEAAHGKPEFAKRTEPEIRQMTFWTREFVAGIRRSFTFNCPVPTEPSIGQGRVTEGPRARLSELVSTPVRLAGAHARVVRPDVVAGVVD